MINPIIFTRTRIPIGQQHLAERCVVVCVYAGPISSTYRQNLDSKQGTIVAHGRQVHATETVAQLRLNAIAVAAAHGAPGLDTSSTQKAAAADLNREGVAAGGTKSTTVVTDRTPAGYRRFIGRNVFKIYASGNAFAAHAPPPPPHSVGQSAAHPVSGGADGLLTPAAVEEMLQLLLREVDTEADAATATRFRGDFAAIAQRARQLAADGAGGFSHAALGQAVADAVGRVSSSVRQSSSGLGAWTTRAASVSASPCTHTPAVPGEMGGESGREG
jgi:hypothetical protein